MSWSFLHYYNKTYIISKKMSVGGITGFVLDLRSTHRTNLNTCIHVCIQVEKNTQNIKPTAMDVVTFAQSLNVLTGNRMSYE